MKKTVYILGLLMSFSSCGILRSTKEEHKVFTTLRKMDFPHQEFINEQTLTSLQNVLSEEEIVYLNSWSNTAPFLKNFVDTECVGCSNKSGHLKPIYRVKRGKFIHFGLQSEMGVENWVFKKSGAFVARFHSFQGETKEGIRKALKDIQNIDYVLEGVYPINIDKQTVYLEHIQFENPQAYNNEWYQPMFPTKIGYAIDLMEKQPELRFKIDGGLFSYQRLNEHGAYQIINFVEPLVYANAVDIDEPMSYSSFTNVFYANATFLLLNLEENAQVSIRIESKTLGTAFKFSLLENNGFHTIEEYLQKESPLFDQYQNTMEKGSYLIRVIHENSNYAEKPLYTVYIEKNALE